MLFIKKVVVCYNYKTPAAIKTYAVLLMSPITGARFMTALATG